MTNTPKLCCSRCKSHVNPIKALTDYVCPKCLGTFTASQVAQAIADENAKSKHAKSENAEVLPVVSN